MLQKIKGFESYLISEEKSKATVMKYTHDVTAFVQWLNGQQISKTVVQEYKQWLEGEYAPKSVNSILSSLNSFFEWIDHPEYRVKSLKIQQNAFIEPNRELTKAEYDMLLKTAYEQGKTRLYLVMQTICATGIRVSELAYITVDAVKNGVARIKCKGKNRVIFIPSKLCKMLQRYIREKNIRNGAVFVTRRGKPLNRSNLWAEMKRLCVKAGVLASKVFPHNLRHLFGKTYYAVYQDIVRLADILGHSSINTTRIYTAESGEVHRKRIQKLGLIRDYFLHDTT
ncbi:tyrosine-type recombinase/integrase [Lachnospiraceae bacterium MD329]|nr:tyrosine-type recombinase/integrase [Lachnospiraceae bacterium MD329]